MCARWSLVRRNECWPSDTEHPPSGLTSAPPAGTALSGSFVDDKVLLDTGLSETGHLQHHLLLKLRRAHDGRALRCEASNAYGTDAACFLLDVQCMHL